MSGNDAPAPPDYSPIINAVQGLANTDTGYATNQMGWAQNAYNHDLNTTGQVVGQDLGVQGDQNSFSRDIQNQYENTYVPLENQFADQAKNYASQGNIDQQMGMAEANTAQAMDQSRANAQRDLESFGISPDATRYAALDIGQQAQKGAAVAASGNAARQNTINTGLGLESTAIGQGEVMPSMSAGLTNVGLQAGSGAVNSSLATTASGANTMGTTPQYMNLANGAYGLWGNTLNSQYGNQLAQFNANQAASSGLGMLVGAGAGMMGNVFKGAGTNMLAGFAKGGAVGDDDGDEGPFVSHHFYVLHGHDEAGQRLQPHEAVQHLFKTGQHIGTFPSPEHAQEYVQRQDYSKGNSQHYAVGGPVLDRTQGGGVPIGASPSQGAVTDDVDAKLNAGEFVIPKDVTKWKGQEFFQKMIQQARKARAGAPAHPDFSPLPPMQRGAVQ